MNDLNPYNFLSHLFHSPYSNLNDLKYHISQVLFKGKDFLSNHQLNQKVFNKKCGNFVHHAIKTLILIFQACNYLSLLRLEILIAFE